MSIYDLSGEQLLTLSWLIATKSVQGLSLAEQDVLGYFFTSFNLLESSLFANIRRKPFSNFFRSNFLIYDVDGTILSLKKS